MEAEWIRRARKGDEVAYQLLVECHQEAIFRLAYLMLGNVDEAQDIAQDTFVRAYHALAGFDETRPLRPWLFRITSNLARNRRRALGRYWGAIKRFARYNPTSSPTLENEHLEQARARELWRAVRRLNHAEQEIIYLRFFLSLTVDETAEALSIQPGTVKSRLHRALNRLRGVIEHEFPTLREASYE